jgi:hypothetical protein
MSPALTPEQYERWHFRTCAGCGRRAAKTANWPGGPVCRTCYERAARTYAGRLAALPDDGTGRVDPALGPLFDALTSMDKPKAA